MRKDPDPTAPQTEKPDQAAAEAVAAHPIVEIAFVGLRRNSDGLHLSDAAVAALEKYLGTLSDTAQLKEAVTALLLFARFMHFKQKAPTVAMVVVHLVDASGAYKRAGLGESLIDARGRMDRRAAQFLGQGSGIENLGTAAPQTAKKWWELQLSK